MGKPTLPSMELERSMNLQVHVMTVEETLRHSAVIDKLDDERRTKLHNLIKWAKEMQISFIRDLQEIYKSTGLESLRKEIEKQSKFLKQFTKSIDAILKQELELEALDDNTREYLIDYAVMTRENLKEDNSRLEREIILRKVSYD
ncbi:MAG: hypothetical protein ACLUBL_08490 [Fusobacterium sp.]|uniref:hypothetical protein n=1 Tax=Fusobacterium sp. TaxID=68766 RepID=UPI0039968BBD